MPVWSEQQSAIFDQMSSGSGNLLVRARAGTGKTTTICEGVRNASGRVLLAAFNKKIAEELQSRVGHLSNVEAKTLHSIGFSLVRRHCDDVRIDAGRGDALAIAALGEGEHSRDLVKLVSKLASLGKSVAPHGDPTEIYRVALDYDVTPDEAQEKMGYNTARIALVAHDAMSRALVIDYESPAIDFDDMVYLPVALKLASPRYDMVVIDEAQDMNQSQLELALAICRGRVVVVGDDRQAIYGFRGASSGALDSLKTQLNAKELSLNVTFRCAQSIVEHAKRLVPDFVAHASNPPGIIQECGRDQLIASGQAGDFVISRKNAPLAGLALSFIRAGKAARIEGRDIGKALAGIVKKCEATMTADMIERLKKWRDKEVAKAIRVHGEKAAPKILNINDQFETIIAMTDDLEFTFEVLNRMEMMFSDKSESDRYSCILLSSIHRAKGLEADRVFVLRDTLYPFGDRTDQEERNLEYVACTRAKSVLVWVGGVS